MVSAFYEDYREGTKENKTTALSLSFRAFATSR